MKNILFFFIALILFSAISLKIQAQDVQEYPPLTIDACNSPVVSSVGTVYGCAGNVYNFTPSVSAPGLTITNWSWSPAGDLSSPPSGTGAAGLASASITTPTVCTTYNLTVGAEGPNIIQEGAFFYYFACDAHNGWDTYYHNGCGSSGWDPGRLKVSGAQAMNSHCVTPYTTTPDWDSHTADGTEMLAVNALTVGIGVPIPYFWGQSVNLCLGAKYKFSYWIRSWNVITGLGEEPKTEIYFGSAGSAPSTLKHGHSGGVFLDSVRPSITGNGFGASYLNTCNTVWEEDSMIFTSPVSGTWFVCMASWNDVGNFAIDDISLKRIGIVSSGPAITLCPVALPTTSITYTLPAGCDPNPCPGTPVHFTIHGAVGEKVTYKTITPAGTSAPIVHTMTSTSYALPALTAPTGSPGNVCVQIIDVSTSGCDFTETITSCVDEEWPTATISAPGSICQGDAPTILVYGPPGGTVTITPTDVYSGPGTPFVVNTAGYGTGVPYTYIPIYNEVTFCVTNVASSCCSKAVAGPCVSVIPALRPYVLLTVAPSVICPDIPIELTATSVVPDAPVSYSFNGPPGSGLPAATYYPVDSVAAINRNGYYTVTTIDAIGCSFTDSLFITSSLPLPTITGQDTVCTGATTTLYISDDGYWSSSNTAIASVDTGPAYDSIVVSGVSGGIATLTFTETFGCFKTTTVDVLDPPGMITGNDKICAGETTALTCKPEGGVWTSSSIGIATVDPVTGVVTGVVEGVPATVTITYTTPCGASTKIITIKLSPLPIYGPSSVCVGSSINLADGTAGGVWADGPPGISTVTAGVVTGLHPGTSVIVYTITSSHCATTDTITVNPLPLPISLTATKICVGDVLFASDATQGGGTWSTSPTAIATVEPTTGIVTGVSGGTVTITYTLPTGCYATAIATIVSLPALVTGSDTVCVGSVIILSDATIPGNFALPPATLAATITASGILTGVSSGTAIVSYYSAATGCHITDTIVVDSLPIVPNIKGADTVCIGATTEFIDAVVGGTWSSINSSIATVDSVTGIITGISGGGTVIRYTVTNNCGRTHINKPIFVKILPVVPPISGFAGICTGTDDTLYNAVPGGVWTSADAGIAVIDPVSGIASGTGTGLVNVFYTVTNSCGSTQVNKTLSVDMPPYITTNFVVACQTLANPALDGSGPGLPTIVSSAGCMFVCDSSTVRYYGNGSTGGIMTWEVLGGTVTHNYGDSIDVFWGISGITGSVILFDSVSHCSGEDSICIQVIEKPHADFSVSSSSVCLNSVIFFNDLSLADPSSPIASHYWNFGDGRFSTMTNTYNEYTTTGTDTVTLIVKNICGCADTARQLVNILSTPGPKIQCPAIACEGDNVTYSVADIGMSCYNWSVIGGTIVSGFGTPAIVIKWDHITDGYGYVSIWEDCGTLCNDTSTIKVPVIMIAPAISGPSSVCVGAQNEYELPLWPGTQYSWGVLGHPEAVVGIRNDHKVVLQFLAPGTYTIHGWYQNRITLCGGNINKTITVLPVTNVNGNTTVCQNNPYTYSLANGFSATWTLMDITGSTITSSSGTSFSYSFPTGGSYILDATGSFCANSITINVTQTPPVIDTIYGPDTVCLNRLYSYSAGNYDDGDNPVWTIAGGTVTPASGYNVNVTWTSSGIKTLSANRRNNKPPFCTGPVSTIHVQQESISSVLTGDTSVCTNSREWYYCSYTRGETYDWIILPNTAGSLITGDHTPSAAIDWYNLPGTAPIHASVIVTIHKCDSVYNDTLVVKVKPQPNITLTATPTTVCPGALVGFKASPGDSIYIWNFGDGWPLVLGIDTMTRTFASNTTTANVNYIVNVTGIPFAVNNGCVPVDDTTTTVSILPGPLAHLSADRWYICDSLDTAIFSANITNNVGGVTYQWYKYNTLITGATDTFIAVHDSFNYYFTVTAGDGCSAKSNTFYEDKNCGPEGPSCGSIDATTTVSCDTVYLQGNTYPGGSDYYWELGAGYSYASGLSSPNAVAVYDTPGIYYFSYNYHADTCGLLYKNLQNTVGIVANFYYQVVCAAPGIDSVLLHDHTSFLPGWTVGTIDWFNGGTYLGSGTNFQIAIAAPGSYNITQVVHYTGLDGLAATCQRIHRVILPDHPHSVIDGDFIYGASCEGLTQLFFSMGTGGIVHFLWEFGDGSSSSEAYPIKAFTWNPLFPFNPHPFNVSLIVTDTLGCSDSSTQPVLIYHNLMDGNLGPNQVICSKDAPAILTWLNASGAYTPNRFTWTNGFISNTTYIGIDTVTSSGAYWVTVYDSTTQCRATRPAPTVMEVKIIPTPDAQFTGIQNYCLGDVIQLYSAGGDGDSLRWFRNDTLHSTDYDISDSSLAARLYEYKLVLSVTDDGFTCYDTSAIDSVHMFPLPPHPAITGPMVLDCASYTMQLTASEPMDGVYNWSNGTNNAVDVVNEGGPYRVWFTDLQGCINYSDAHVPLSVAPFFAYFPTGCYTICAKELPVVLSGPPNDTFEHWAWLDNGDTLMSGSNTVMPPLNVDSSGNYQWYLNNAGCGEVSDTMDVTVVPCAGCQPFPIDVTLLCDGPHPASYRVTITSYSPGTGTYVVGTDMGPIDPFSGSLPAYGVPYTLSLTFTTFDYIVPFPDSVTVEIAYTLDDGTKCFQTKKVHPPMCTWSPSTERSGGDTVNNNSSQVTIHNALLVYPNPTSGEVTLSYDYGTDQYKERNLSVYDAMGRRKQYMIPQDVRGNWEVNTNDWAPGVYIIRMDADGQALQTQRMVVVNK